MLKVKDECKGLDIELQLDEQDVATLSAFVKQQGFDVMQKIMEDCVRKFNFKLLNTNPANKEEVLAAHYLAKSVAMFYTSLMDRINQVCAIEMYNNRDKSIVEPSITAQQPEYE